MTAPHGVGRFSGDEYKRNSAPPLICAEGRPSAAFHRLVGAVVAGRGELRYHGDDEESVADPLVADLAASETMIAGASSNLVTTPEIQEA